MATGTYIVIEGPDGTGKTTQAHMLVEAFERRGHKSRYVHEPGETAMGLALEKIIKDRSLERRALTDLLLFTANRIEVYNQIIQPALTAGTAIVADRNWLSSLAYQGVAGELGVDAIVNETRRHLPTAYLYPRFTVLLRIADAQRGTMLHQRGTSEGDYFESRPDTFQQAIMKGYREAETMMASLQNTHQSLAYASVVADGTPQEVHTRIITTLEEAKII